jgi:hypothetical protein
MMKIGCFITSKLWVERSSRSGITKTGSLMIRYHTTMVA